jgi:ADP-heptose:LPS heptosyltransferase
MPKVSKKTLCILFKYLGDVAVAVPAMRALKQSRPEDELHILVAEEAVPIVRHLPWVTRVWGLPRKRGRAQLGSSLPVIASLRKQQFALSVDFVGNDRGALLSLLVGAKERVGLISKLGFWGRKRCYNSPVLEEEIPNTGLHETQRHLRLIRGLGVAQDAPCTLELHPHPSCSDDFTSLIERGSILAHISTSQPKKEWPMEFWRDLHVKASRAGVQIVFSSGPSDREQAILEMLSKLEPAAHVLKRITSLDLYLSILAKARAFISGDTGPLHFAAGLGVPTLSMFAATDAHRWAPMGKPHRCLIGAACHCSGHAHVCTHPAPCIQTISVDAVWKELQDLLKTTNRTPHE